MIHQALKQRFLAKVDKRGPDECWPWTAARSNGVGVMRWLGRTRSAHQLAWEIRNHQDIMHGLQLYHTCGNRYCCNPDHLTFDTRYKGSRRPQD